MVQLINIIGDAYVVWDKSAEIYFRKPAKEHLFANFEYSHDEIEGIKARIRTENEIEIVKTTQLTNKEQTTVYCEVKKTIYLADKSFFKSKKARRSGGH